MTDLFSTDLKINPHVLLVHSDNGCQVVDTSLARVIPISEALYKLLVPLTEPEDMLPEWNDTELHFIKKLYNQKILVAKKQTISRSLKLSFVVPAYNSEKTIKNCLENISKQIKQQKDPSLFEIIVVNNASTDQTKQIAQQYADIIIDEPKKNRALARNRGILKAKGEFIAFIDSDNLIQEGWLTAVLDAIEEADDVAGVQTKISFKTEPQNSWLAKFRNQETIYSKERMDFGYKEPFAFLDTASCVYRYQALEEINGFTEDFARSEDVDISWKIIAAGWSLRFITNAISYDYVTDGSLLNYFKRSFQIALADYILHRRWRLFPGNKDFFNLSRNTYPNISFNLKILFLSNLYSYNLGTFCQRVRRKLIDQSLIVPYLSPLARHKNKNIKRHIRFWQVGDRVMIVCLKRFQKWHLDKESSKVFLQIVRDEINPEFADDYQSEIKDFYHHLIDNEIIKKDIKENSITEDRKTHNQIIVSTLRKSLTINGFCRIRLQGNSMSPTIKNGTLLTIHPVISLAYLNAGDVIAYHDEKYKLVVHRISKIDGEKIYCKGDAKNSKSDPAVSFENILGDVVSLKTFWDEQPRYIAETSAKLPSMIQKLSPFLLFNRARVVSLGAQFQQKLSKNSVTVRVPQLHYKLAQNFLVKQFKDNPDCQLCFRGSFPSGDWTPGYSDIDPYFVVTKTFINSKEDIQNLVARLKKINKLFPMVQHSFFMEESIFKLAVAYSFIGTTKNTIWHLPQQYTPIDQQNLQYDPIIAKILQDASRLLDRIFPLKDALYSFDQNKNSYYRQKLTRAEQKVRNILAQLIDPNITGSLEIKEKIITAEFDLAQSAQITLENSDWILGTQMPDLNNQQDILYDPKNLIPESFKILQAKTSYDHQLKYGIHGKLHAVFSICNIAKRLSEHALNADALYFDNNPLSEERFNLICERLQAERSDYFEIFSVEDDGWRLFKKGVGWLSWVGRCVDSPSL